MSIGEVRGEVEQLRDEILNDGRSLDVKERLSGLEGHLGRVSEEIRGLAGELIVIEAERGVIESGFADIATDRDLQAARAMTIATGSLSEVAIDAVRAVSQAATVDTEGAGQIASTQEILDDARDQLLAAGDAVDQVRNGLRIFYDPDNDPDVADSRATELLDHWVDMFL